MCAFLAGVCGPIVMKRDEICFVLLIVIFYECKVVFFLRFNLESMREMQF